MMDVFVNQSKFKDNLRENVKAVLGLIKSKVGNATIKSFPETLRQHIDVASNGSNQPTGKESEEKAGKGKKHKKATEVAKKSGAAASSGSSVMQLLGAPAPPSKKQKTTQ